MEYKKCQLCGKEFKTSLSRIKGGRGKYCSRACSNIGQKSLKRPDRVEWCSKLTTLYPQKKKEQHSCWKGVNASYQAIHNWVRYNFGSPLECEHCGKTGDNSKLFQWANINHKYNRAREDWVRLCIKCHEKYDKQNNRKYSA